MTIDKGHSVLKSKFEDWSLDGGKEEYRHQSHAGNVLTMTDIPSIMQPSIPFIFTDKVKPGNMWRPHTKLGGMRSSIMKGMQTMGKLNYKFIFSFKTHLKCKVANGGHFKKGTWEWGFTVDFPKHPKHNKFGPRVGNIKPIWKEGM